MALARAEPQAAWLTLKSLAVSGGIILLLLGAFLDLGARYATTSRDYRPSAISAFVNGWGLVLWGTS